MRDLPLTALHDRRVCIDGNILTLQFHHSNESQHPNRTILGSVRELCPSGRLVRAVILRLTGPRCPIDLYARRYTL